jgi:hypothetical protein
MSCPYNLKEVAFRPPSTLTIGIGRTKDRGLGSLAPRMPYKPINTPKIRSYFAR